MDGVSAAAMSLWEKLEWMVGFRLGRLPGVTSGFYKMDLIWFPTGWQGPLWLVLSTRGVWAARLVISVEYR